jgi:putative flavoprotein involved in K+ transport
MPATTVVVVGAGHSGLAVSKHLTDRSIEHDVLDRGSVANSWRTQRWDSLRLLTPNWMTRLPGLPYTGDDPDGYLTSHQFVDVVQRYAAAIAAPVHRDTTVTAVRATGDAFEIATDAGTWRARAVVLATGLTVGSVPNRAGSVAVPAGVSSVHALDYRNPGGLPGGGVLVVGAAASGVQIALELRAAGREVTLSVGEHVRMPRRYRGRDILWWLDATGILDQRWDELDDVIRARNLPSMQLVGGERTVDLNDLQDAGVRPVGRLGALRDGVAQFAGSLANVCTLADLKLNRLLDTIDAVDGTRGERPEPTRVPTAPLSIDLRSGEIRSIIWATGIGPDFSWLEVPTFDARGRLLHDGGVCAWPGLYALGLPVLRRRRSSLIDGAAGDAADIAAHLHSFLGGTAHGTTERAS